MRSLYDTYDAQDDLDRLEAAGFVADVALLHVFLDQIEESEEALWSLSQYNGEHPDPLFNMKAIDCLHAQGYNIYRIRPLRRITSYRIIYGLDAVKDEIHILAYTRKKNRDAPPGIDPEYYDYEPRHPLSQRICVEYDRLAIPRIPRRR
ncbi:hypothetical protein HLB01_08915 [Bordetella trematum]|uniref:hypothetical protein n=1 Tax=Bordetella trematum TaxID=123899 RepID=UPI000F8E4A44|nr:hypothetical protein [Bordetella trematum]NNH19153.1 hypothetical protein [Bordetella trematum]